MAVIRCRVGGELTECGFGGAATASERIVQDRGYKEITAECEKNAWQLVTDTVVLTTEIKEPPDSVNDPQYSEPVSQARDIIPWLTEEATLSRNRCVDQGAEAKLSTKTKQTPPAVLSDAEVRRATLKTATAAAAEKLKSEAVERKNKAAVKQDNLVKEAAVEFLRKEFGKSNLH